MNISYRDLQSVLNSYFNPAEEPQTWGRPPAHIVLPEWKICYAETN